MVGRKHPLETREREKEREGDKRKEAKRNGEDRKEWKKLERRKRNERGCARTRTR